MGRTSINWMNPDVQQSIDDYICRRIPTQAKLRQVISNHLQQPISEQALSIYLKRTGVSFPRKANSPANSTKLNSDLSQGDSLKQTMATLGGASVAISTAPHSLAASAEHFYATGGQPLFMNALSGGVMGPTGGSASESPSAASSSALIVDASGANSALNFVHVSSSQAAAFSNILDMSSNALRNATANCANNNMLSMNNNNNLQRYILDDSQQQQLRAVEIQHNLQLQQQAAANHWHHQQQQTSQQQQHTNQQQQQSSSSGATNNNGGGGDSSNGGEGSRAAKRPSTASQPINWKDPFVQNAISNYFNRKIKLQTELRLMIMERLKRNVSENSLRLYLKKVKNQFELSSSASSSQQSLILDGLTASSSSNCLSANSATMATAVINDAFRNLTTTVATSSSKSGEHNSQQNNSSNNHQHLLAADSAVVAPSKEIAYYFCNNIASFAGTGPPTMTYAPAGNSGTIQGNLATQQMLHSIESYGFGNNSAGDLVGKSLQLAPPTMVKTLMNEQFFKVHNAQGDVSADHLVKVGAAGDVLHQQSTQQQLGQQSQLEALSNGVMKREKDDVKPSVRRRINWGNADVQNAIQDFYGRKILTQAKLRSIIEAILGHGVSEQALSIYLKRKKSRNPTSEELILMNINCVDENLA